jgi:Asp-tRNA(Asn)/Glu-tRNA(Gln) amidotransferase A subunit family amidase
MCAVNDAVWESVETIADGVSSGRCTARAVTERALARSHDVQSRLNCFAEIADAQALAAADRIDAAVAASQWVGPLAGVPVAIKDSTPAAGLGQRWGSKAYANVIAGHDAAVVHRLKAAGAVIIGKTTLSEVAYSSFCDSPLTGVTRNPWNPARTPGGSSGGSAVAVATGCVTLAEGTDMGGSVRIPASFTGILGMKPSLGRIPNDDMSNAVDDMVHHGLLARSTEDLVRGLGVVFGPDQRDPLSLGRPIVSFDAASKSVTGLRVAVTPDLGFYAVEPYVIDRLHAAAEALSDAGAILSRGQPAWNRSMSDAWVRHWHVYLASCFGDDLERVRGEVDPRLWSLIDRGRDISAVELKSGEMMRTQQWRAMAEFWATADILLSPTMSRTAVDVTEDDTRYHRLTDDGRKHGLDLTSMFNWVPWCPAVSVPAGTAPDGLPVGVHVTAPPFRDDLAVAVAAVIERAMGVPAPPDELFLTADAGAAVTCSAARTEEGWSG